MVPRNLQRHSLRSYKNGLSFITKRAESRRTTDGRAMAVWLRHHSPCLLLLMIFLIGTGFISYLLGYLGGSAPGER